MDEEEDFGGLMVRLYCSASDLIISFVLDNSLLSRRQLQRVKKTRLHPHQRRKLKRVMVRRIPGAQEFYLRRRRKN